jgi:hypothetical protein
MTAALFVILAGSRSLFDFGSRVIFQNPKHMFSSSGTRTYQTRIIGLARNHFESTLNYIVVYVVAIDDVSSENYIRNHQYNTKMKKHSVKKLFFACTCTVVFSSLIFLFIIFRLRFEDRLHFIYIMRR